MVVRGGSGGVEWYQMLGVARGEVFVPVVRREEGGYVRLLLPCG